jgi:pSer/pThr/pTyr-binding forkhead associated (FHA) protein
LIEDLDTTNGTAVNRQRLAPRQTQPIRDGDEIRFGKLVATFHYSA